MDATFYDGRTSRPAQVSLRIVNDRLVFDAPDGAQAWPLRELREELAGDKVRLAWRGDARLLLAAADWAAAGRPSREVHRRTHGRQMGLIAGLTGAGLGLAALVFIGIPLMAGPLARATPPELEARLGHTFEAQLTLGLKPCKGAAGQAALARLGRQLGTTANSPFPIQVQAVRAPFANALALPGGRVLVTDDLIAEARSADELSGVLAHEIAHVQMRHVTEALWRSVGAGMLLDLVVGGGSGAGQQAVLLAAQASDMRYSRKAETEADRRGMEILQASGLSSQGLPAFFERLEKSEGPADGPFAEFLSSHPETDRRLGATRALARPGASALNAEDWAKVRSACAAD